MRRLHGVKISYQGVVNTFKDSDKKWLIQEPFDIIESWRFQIYIGEICLATSKYVVNLHNQKGGTWYNMYFYDTNMKSIKQWKNAD